MRCNTRAVPLALSLMRSLELGGARVLNGSRAYQRRAALLRRLQIPHTRSMAFDDPETALAQLTGGWPALRGCSCCIPRQYRRLHPSLDTRALQFHI
jgi:hypothetical protein